MRLSEAIGLQRDDVDLEAGLLTVRLTKFGKSRLVPLHPSPNFLRSDGRLLHQYVHHVFWRLSREIGLRRVGDRTGPRVHDFRHPRDIQTGLKDRITAAMDHFNQDPVVHTSSYKLDQAA
jgi:integrase